ncbi:outer membrane protein assembly factor BamB family protein [Haladaptatus salinisoli]|uniref:outer membrane protein assembly factor BamB family protein n=1 Tax=Haladaptatus salinisoli TaxID=2884876 RepID=UPI001D0BE0FE|nr:PQQ-binding-like beta-propeller repeat protein [Haladaptatus salinisoli]
MPSEERRTLLKTVGVAVGATGLSGTGAVLARENRDDEDGGGGDEDDSGGSDGVTGWSMYRGDVGRTGSMDDGGPVPHATTDWSMGVGGAMRVNTRAYIAEPVLADGTLYLAAATATGTYDSDGFVAAYDPETGDELWKQSDVPAPQTPAVSDGALYFATHPPGNTTAVEKGGLYALDADDGTILWSRDDHLEWADPLLADGRLNTAYGRFSSDSGTVALDPETGETVWENSDVDADEVCYADGTLFARTGTALNASDGSVKWERSLGSLEAVRGGLVYGTRLRDAKPGYRVSAWATSDGTERWSQKIDINSDEYSITNLAVGNGTVFVQTHYDHPDLDADDVQTLYAFDAETGEREWTFESLASMYGDPAVADGTVYLGGRYAPESESDPTPADYRAFVYAIDADSGEERWNYVMDRRQDAGTPVVSDGKVYVPTFEADSTYAQDTESALFVLESTDDRPDADHRIANDEPGAQDEPPKACIEASPDPRECDVSAGEEITLDGSCSTDSLSSQFVYEWDTDADGEYDEHGETVVVTVPSCGSLKVTLEISDSNGNSDAESIVISAN